jgi:hypothetical protein
LIFFGEFWSKMIDCPTVDCLETMCEANSEDYISLKISNPVFWILTFKRFEPCSCGLF